MADKDCLRTFYPVQAGEFEKGGDANTALLAGYEVTINLKGFIVDIWDPKTGNLLDVLGNITGARSHSIAKSFSQTIQKQGYKTWTPDDLPNDAVPAGAYKYLEHDWYVTVDPKGNIVDIWDPENKTVLNKTMSVIALRNTPFLFVVGGFTTVTQATVDEADLTQALKDWFLAAGSEFPQGQMTVDKDVNFVEFWDPLSNTVMDQEFQVVGKRGTPFNAKTLAKITGAITTYTADSIGDPILTDKVVDLLLDEFEVSITWDEKVVDVWDPETGRRITLDRATIGTRLFPFPSGNNIEKYQHRRELFLQEIENVKINKDYHELTGMPEGYGSLGYDEGGPFGTFIPLFESESILINAKIGFFVGYYNEKTEIVDIQSTENYEIFSITNNDPDTLKAIGQGRRQWPDRIDPKLLKDTLLSHRLELSELVFESNLSIRILRKMQKHKRILNLKKAFDETNR